MNSKQSPSLPEELDDPVDDPIVTRMRHQLARVAGNLRRLVFVLLYKMEIGRGTMISTTAKLDKTNPRGIRIGANTRIAFGAAVLAHDGVNAKQFITRIGDNCLIGAHALVLPGVTIGDNCVVAAGSVVMRDVPSRSLVAGNPAIVVESGIETGRYGRRDVVSSRRAALATLPSTADTPGRLLAVLTEELPSMTLADFDTSFEDLGLDSFGLIAMRARLEQEFGVELDDASWASSRTPSDILSSVLTGSSSSNFEASEATANTPAPFVSGMAKSESASERRTFALSMPQMALKGLSESWLFKEIGDMHWSIIARALRVPSSELRDLEGNRLLATFTRIRVDLDNSAAHFEENQPVTLEARMSRYRSGMFVSTIELSGAQHGGVEVMSNFSRRRQANTNVGLHVSQPIIPRDCSIPFCDEMPAFAVAYRTRRAGVLGDPIFECGYQIQPPHDINGVGLLYFAAYPAIVDISASDYAGRAFTLEMSTRARDVYYFANCEPDDALTFRIHKWKPTRDGIRFESSLSRQSDGVLMAHIVTSKGFV